MNRVQWIAGALLLAWMAAPGGADVKRVDLGVQGVT